MASTEKDRIIVARIAGAASRHARAHPLSHAEQQDAIAELAAVADGRADLLAEHAGLAIGCHEGDLDEPRHLRAAQLCINAGADTSLIPRWIEEGRRRAAAAADRHRRLIAAARHPGVGGRSAVSHGTRSRHPGGSLRRDSAEHDAVGLRRSSSPCRWSVARLRLRRSSTSGAVRSREARPGGPVGM